MTGPDILLFALGCVALVMGGGAIGYLQGRAAERRQMILPSATAVRLPAAGPPPGPPPAAVPRLQKALGAGVRTRAQGVDNGLPPQTPKPVPTAVFSDTCLAREMGLSAEVIDGWPMHARAKLYSACAAAGCSYCKQVFLELLKQQAEDTPRPEPFKVSK